MSASNPATVSSSSTAATNTWLSGLNWGSYWDTPSSSTAVIYYYVAGNESIRLGNLNSLTSFDTVAAEAPMASELAAINLAMQLYENVANIDFVATTSLAQADLVWAFSSNYPSGAYGVACPPGEFFNNAINDYQGGVAINTSAYEGSAAGSGLAQGGYDFITIIHELGHALGMAHPHDNGGTSTVFPGVSSSFGDYGDFDMNQGIFTTMSYNDGWKTGLGSSPSNDYGWQGTPMALDVAWMQAVYGANTSFRSGSDTYVLGDSATHADALICIWDTGGTDAINYGGAFNCTIDLRAATLATAAGGGGYVSYVSGAPTGALDHWNAFTIAAGAVIENATGGAGNDTLQGNDGANVLSGGGGNDTLYGDSVVATGTSGISLGSGQIAKSAGAGNTSIATAINISSAFSLAADADIAAATTTPHVSISGTGDGHVDYYAVTINNAGATITLDIDYGDGDGTPASFDSYVALYNSSGTQLTFNDDSPTASGAGGSTSGLDSFLSHTFSAAGTYYIAVGAYPALTTIASGGTYELQVSVAGELVTTAAGGRDTLVGGAGNDALYGGAGNDFLNGQTGRDQMVGGIGDDTYVVNMSTDVVSESAGGGVDWVRSTSASYSLAANVENLQLNGAGHISGGGNGEDNIIRGNVGNNTILGRGGNDTLSGGAGLDTFVFNAALGAGNIDRILDFSHADDTIQLDDARFAGLALGQLDADAFYVVGSGLVRDAEDRIIYNSGNGSLQYDADGAGGAAGIVFAIVVGAPANLDASDFLVV